VDKFDATLIASLGTRLRQTEEMLNACQQVTQRQRKEIQALRMLLDTENIQVEKVSEVEGLSLDDIEWSSASILKREA